jgi:hypothetical protein
MLEMPNTIEFGEIPRGIMPIIGKTLDIPFSDKIVQMHFLRENGDWFAVEYDPVERMFYGYIDVHPGDPHWGYFGIEEVVDCWIQALCSIPEVELNWKPKKAKEISSILGGE